MSPPIEIEVTPEQLNSFVSGLSQDESGAYEVDPTQLNGFVTELTSSAPPVELGGWDTLKNIASKSIDDIGQFLFQDIPNLANSAYERTQDPLDFAYTGENPGFGEQALGIAKGVGGELLQYDPSAGAVQNTVTAANNIGRGAFQTAATIATSVFAPALAPAAVGVSGHGWDILAQGLGLQPITSMDEALDKFRKEVVLSGVAMAAPTAIKAATSIPGDVRALTNLPSRVAQEAQIAARPDAIVAAMGPKGQSAVAQVFRDDLQKATPTYISEAKTLWEGVDGTKLEPFAARANKPAAQAEIDKFQSNVTKRVTELSDMKQWIIRKVDEITHGTPQGKIGAADLGFDDIKEMIKQRDKSAITAESSQVLKEVLAKLQDDFFHDTGIIDPKGGTFKLAKDYNIKAADDILGNIYNRLEQAKAFDAVAEVQGNVNPGAIAANEEIVFALRKAAKELRTRMSQKADSVIQSNPTIFNGPSGESVPKGGMATINEKIHNLIPFRDAVEAYVSDTAMALGIPRRGASGASGLFTEVTRPLYENVATQRQLGAALERDPALGRRLDLIRQYQGANALSVPQPRVLDLYGSTKRARELIGASSAMAAEAERQARAEEKLFSWAERYEFDPILLQNADIQEDAQGDTIYVDEMEDQEDIKYDLTVRAHNKDLPWSYVAKQSSQFSDPTKPSVLLPPYKSPKTGSEPDVKLKKPTSSSPAKYSY